ncbi:SPOR domain-containing protein [Streptomyces sp. NPDC004031]
MRDMTSDLVWALIRQDDGTNRYRVGRYATRAEAERVGDLLDGCGREHGTGDSRRRYVVERIAPRVVHV